MSLPIQNLISILSEEVDKKMEPSMRGIITASIVREAINKTSNETFDKVLKLFDETDLASKIYMNAALMYLMCCVMSNNKPDIASEYATAMVDITKLLFELPIPELAKENCVLCGVEIGVDASRKGHINLCHSCR